MADESAAKVAAEAQKKLTGLEGWLDGIFGARFPVQIPKAGREWIVKVAPWLALVGGVLSLWASWAFWQAGHYVNRLADWANSLSAAYGVPTTSNRLGFMWYVALVVLLVQAVLMLVAFPKLKEHKKAGWNLLFYSSLVALVLGVVELFVSGYGFGSLIGSLIGTAIGMFLLFQVRSYYKA